MSINAINPMTTSGKALVMGDDTRSFLATVRSLGRKGIEVHAAPFNMRAPALSSRYICKVHLLPYYLNGGVEWLEAMQKLMQAEQFDLIIPCEERSLLPLYKHQHELPACALAIPSQRALEAFFDKINTRNLATQLGVPVAKGKQLLTTDTADTLLAELTLPIIAKQRKSYSWPELYVRTTVEMIENRSQLDSLLRNTHKDNGHIFFEQMFAGRGLGVSVLCKQGVVLQAFEHHRAHELSGSSYYRNSAPLNPARLAAVSRMTVAVEFTGLAMFEFKLNENTGEWILLEVNARPWGSMPLPVAAGIDFPYLLYQMLVKGDLALRRTYQPNIYGRNLIPDLWQLRSHLQELSPNRGRQLAHLFRWVSEWRRVLIGCEHHDAMVFDDMRPGWVEIKQFLAEHFWLRLTSCKRHRSVGTISLAARIISAQAKGKPVHIVFVCQGNICRSPYAELKAKQFFGCMSEQVRFSSAGILPRNRRGSPSLAIEAAKQHGIDLTNHKSQHAFEPMMRDAKAIIIFDEINLKNVLDRYPDMQDKVYLICEVIKNNTITEVNDPNGLDLNVFLQTYGQIDTCINHMKIKS